MRRFLAAFRPMGAVSKYGALAIIAFWLGAGFFVWSRSGWRVFPQPGPVFAAFGKLWMHQGLAKELWTSFVLNLEAVSLSAAICLVIVYLSVLPVFRPTATVVSVLRFLSLAGLPSVAFVALGSPHAAKLALLTIFLTATMVTTMRAEVMAIKPETFDHARSLRMGPWQVVYEVVVLGTADKALEAVKQNVGFGWALLTMIEPLTRFEGGVGTLLVTHDKYAHFPEIYAMQFAIAALGLGLDYAAGVIRNLACPYAANGGNGGAR